MTRVCLVGADDVNLRYELLSRETARDALATYDLREPFENTVGLATVSLGAAVALLNDLNWYLVRFVDEAMVLEPSVSETEWLSRDLATAVRDDTVEPDEIDRFCKIYGLEPANVDDSDGGKPDGDDFDGDGPDGTERGGVAEGDDRTDSTGPGRLVEPMYVTRTGGSVPDYDLRDVEETVVERVTKSEFEG
ncbi:hypothetical protein I7X12_18225 [Halosimplex litoreum]|uniref:Uncharacterized protein n=1 Tax=Halosimplex litoreum TaxID=1198301 RepID=A0A7T3KVA6_9EURY|nr:DUF5804 family protein [Halosimplex litoreum]QPV62640.1 hypothetical protein I7X12_18225 [Halosimplex litoreum]